MTKPDLMAELAEVVTLLDDMQSWIGPRRPDARDAEEREQWDQIERAKTTIRTHHAELEAVVRFHAFFADKCEGLYHEFGWDAIDLYNAASRAMHNSAREGL